MDPPPVSDAAVRKAIFRRSIDDGFPPPVERLMGDLRASRDQIESALDRLEAARHLKLVPGTHRILMAFPVSAVATPYRVTIASGQRYFANCAWDAVAFHTMLRAPVHVDSYCYHCGEGISFDLAGNSISGTPGSEPVVYLGLPAAEWWQDIVRTCGNTMVFFADVEHFDEWRKRTSGADGVALSVAVTLQLSEPIYSKKLDLDYARPSRDILAAHFRHLGLSGEFWKI